MTASLIPAAAAMARFFPEVNDLYDCFRATLLDHEAAKVLLVEGDLTLEAEGLLQTDQLLPALIGDEDQLVGIVVTGDLRAPRATLLEPDIDWSPRVRILGNLHVGSLCLGGSVFEVTRDLKAESTIFGYYNHGILRVGGRAEAKVILTSDYTMQFGGKVACPRVLAHVPRLNIEPHFEGDALADILDPDLIDSYNSPKEADIIQRLGAGGSILKRAGRAKRAVSKVGAEKLAAIAARAAAGEAIVEIDLTNCELRFVPEEIRRYRDLRVLRLSKNNLGSLPEWIGELAGLEVLKLESCGLKGLPSSLALHPRLRELEISHNEIVDLPLVDGAFPALEHLHIGRGWDEDHIDFVADLDLAAFPRLRFLHQDFSNLPHLAYRARARLWNAPPLEYFNFNAIFDERVPRGLAELKGLRGLECSIANNAFASALDVLAQLPELEVLTLSFGSELDAKRLGAVQAALPNVYVRTAYYEPFEKNEADERHALGRKLSDLVRADAFAEAASLADRLFGLVDIERPDVPSRWLENAMRDRVVALATPALTEPDPARRRVLMERSVAWADRVLALLPKTPDIVWWTDPFDLGLLRLDCLLAKADALADHGGADGVEEAKRLIDRLAFEVERHIADFPWRLPECRDRIAWRRARLQG